MNNEERNIERHADGEIRADERPLAQRTPVPGAEGTPGARGKVVVMRRKKSFSSNDFAIEDENGDELGAIVEAERKAPRFFKAFRDFDIGGPRIGLRARITRKTLKPRGGPHALRGCRPRRLALGGGENQNDVYRQNRHRPDRRQADGASHERPAPVRGRLPRVEDQNRRRGPSHAQRRPHCLGVFP